MATTVVVVGSIVSASGTQAAPRPQTTAAGAFSPGVAKATAVVAKVAPGVGSLTLGTTTGVAVSQLTNQLAQSEATALNLGLIGSSLTAEGCDGGEATVKEEDLPHPLSADNRNGDMQVTEDYIPVAGSTLGGGRMFAEAMTQPRARAVANDAEMVVGPALAIGSGRSEAIVQVVDDTYREARASASVDLDIAGVVSLKGMRWEAFHQSGGKKDKGASFEVAHAAAAGVPLPISDLNTLGTAINTALAPSGVSVQFPNIEQFEEPADLIRISPMRIVIKDSPAGKTVLGPVLDLSREQRAQLFDDLVAAYCSAAGALLVGDIAISVAAGTGFLAFEIGGAEATSGEFEEGSADIDNPAGGGLAPNLPGAIIPGTSGTPGTPGTDTPVAPTTPTQPTADVGPLERICESVHPFRWPSCGHGAAMPLGLIGLATTVGIGALDFRHQRKRRGIGPISAVPA